MTKTSQPSKTKQRNPQLLWLKDVPEDKKEAFVNYLKSESIVLPQLSKIIDLLVAKTERQERSIENYTKPNWSERQAHINGYIQAMIQIKELITNDRSIR